MELPSNLGDVNRDSCQHHATVRYHDFWAKLPD